MVQTKVTCGGREWVEKEVNIRLKLHEYNKLKQISINNVLGIKINIIFGININSSSVDRREDSNLDTQWDFTKKTTS